MNKLKRFFLGDPVRSGAMVVSVTVKDQDGKIILSEPHFSVEHSNHSPYAKLAGKVLSRARRLESEGVQSREVAASR